MAHITYIVIITKNPFLKLCCRSPIPTRPNKQELFSLQRLSGRRGRQPSTDGLMDRQSKPRNRSSLKNTKRLFHLE